MSWQAVNWVLAKSKTKGSDRLILVAIADRADRSGRNAHPSIPDIANRAGVSQRHVERQLAVDKVTRLSPLEATGELQVERHKVAVKKGPRTYWTHRYSFPLMEHPTRGRGVMVSGVPQEDPTSEQEDPTSATGKTRHPVRGNDPNDPRTRSLEFEHRAGLHREGVESWPNCQSCIEEARTDAS